MNRKKFIKINALASAALFVNPLITACDNLAGKPKPEISLAQWSLNKSLFSNKISTLDFPVIAKKEFGVSIVEYVNQFFKDQVSNSSFIKELVTVTKNEGVKNNLIMIDGEGELSSNSIHSRIRSIDEHLKWFDFASKLGCNSVRVNLHGHGVSERQWIENSIDSLIVLSNQADKRNLNVLVENHGQWSSKANALVKVIEGVGSENCGLLPDFGNFCVRRRDGDLWSSPCVENYDMYQGVKEMLPYAKGVSAKTFGFDLKGFESTIDYRKMFEMMSKIGFNGIIGVEFEGKGITEYEGIRKTKKLISEMITEYY